MKTALVSMLWMTLLACSGHAEEPQKKPETMANYYTRQTRINDVMNDAVFGDYGRLIFPVNTGYWSGTTLEQLQLTWYNYIDPDKTVEVCNYLRAHADNCFIDIYTEAEKQANPELRNTGLFFFRGNSNAPFAICNAGGGFSYVGAMHDSFPHALELSKLGYNAFALIYRPGDAYEDLARAIAYICDHADELGVSRTGYSLWGGSAGARMDPKPRWLSCNTRATPPFHHTTAPPTPAAAPATASPHGAPCRAALKVSQPSASPPSFTRTTVCSTASASAQELSPKAGLMMPSASGRVSQVQPQSAIQRPTQDDQTPSIPTTAHGEKQY